jgi:hydroxypyruvate reductase
VLADPAGLLRALFDAALAAASPDRVRAHLPAPPHGRTVVIGAGKAAAAMARAVEDAWSGPLSGLVVTRYGHGVPCERIEVIEAAHPVPDDAGERAARHMLERVAGLSRDDLVVCLLSGGGSALLALPAAGVTLADKQHLARALLASGASIAEINCVRKHVSAIKGGRLALACAPARVCTLAISDVPGDDPAVIASGPTVADPTTCADARAVLARYSIAPPPAIDAHLRAARDETPKPGDLRLANTSFTIVARARDALEAAAALARQRGMAPLLLGDALQGEARALAAAHAELVRAARRERTLPCVLLSGGETTVTVRGRGRGGRNSEYLLALALALDGEPGAHALACDTDGIDGTQDNAGALLAPDTLARARALGVDAAERLRDNDAYGFFAALGDLIVTGPTRTNVNDFRAILLE